MDKLKKIKQALKALRKRGNFDEYTQGIYNGLIWCKALYTGKPEIQDGEMYLKKGWWFSMGSFMLGVVSTFWLGLIISALVNGIS